MRRLFLQITAILIVIVCIASCSESPSKIRECIKNANNYKTDKNYEKAILEYSKAIELGPSISESYECYFGRGFSYNQVKNHEKAIADYSEAITIAVGYDDSEALYRALYNRAYAYRDKGDYKEAIEDYTEGIRMFPDDNWIYRDRGFPIIIIWNMKKLAKTGKQQLNLDLKKLKNI